MEFLHVRHTWYVPVLSWHTRTNAKDHILSPGSSKKKKTGTRGNNIVRCCLLYFYYFQVSFFRSFWRFFFAKMYAPGPNGDCIVSTKQPPTQNEVVVFMHAYIVKNRAGMIQHSPRYVHTSEYNQSTPTTKTVVRVYSCVTLFYT